MAIATEHGTYAASQFLRHSDTTTTARHYADQKARLNVGLGQFLDTTPMPEEIRLHHADEELFAIGLAEGVTGMGLVKGLELPLKVAGHRG